MRTTVLCALLWDLGLMYRYGQGVERNGLLAFVWLDVACAQLRQSLRESGLWARVASWGPMGGYLRDTERERWLALQALPPERRAEAKRLGEQYRERYSQK